MHRGSGLDQRCMRNPRQQTERSQELGHGSQSDDRVVNYPPRLKKKRLVGHFLATRRSSDRHAATQAEKRHSLLTSVTTGRKSLPKKKLRVPTRVRAGSDIGGERPGVWKTTALNLARSPR